MPGPLGDAGLGLGLGLAAAGLAGGAWAYCAMVPGSQIFGRTLIAGNDPREVALTFDDGPNGDTTLRLLEVLAGHEARATFFLIGRFVREQPEVVRAIAAAGHVVGNHTMTHPWLHVQSARRIREELAGCNQTIEDVLGAPVRFFRPPHGARRPYVLRTAAELGLTPVQWNVMAYDWVARPVEELVGRVTAGIARNQGRGGGSNVLLHDGGDRELGQARGATVEAVARLLDGFAGRGLVPVTVGAWARG